MEELLPITNLNDFLFCPRSLYYGNIFRRSLGEDGFQQLPQKTGLAAHKSIDDGNYSSCANVLTGTMVYCERFGLIGRIDIFDADAHLLTERKWSVSAVWEGFKLQLYAQYLALGEMGFIVEKMRIHSKKDNRIYDVQIPGNAEISRLEDVIAQMRAFRIDAPFQREPRKCANCIYRELCDVYEREESTDDVIA